MKGRENEISIARLVVDEHQTWMGRLKYRKPAKLRNGGFGNRNLLAHQYQAFEAWQSLQ